MLHVAESLGRYLDLMQARVDAGLTEGVMPSGSYYWTVHWRELRAEMLDRAGHRCEAIVISVSPAGVVKEIGRCGNTARLVVHHKTYLRLWNEHPSDLVVLCQNCHKDHHKRHRAPKDVWWATERGVGES